MITKVQTEGESVFIINIYAREGKLNYKQLIYLFENYKNVILLGDLNAKHEDILIHT